MHGDGKDVCTAEKIFNHRFATPASSCSGVLLDSSWSRAAELPGHAARQAERGKKMIRCETTFRAVTSARKALNMAVVAPSPTAKVRTATAVKPGDLASERRA